MVVLGWACGRWEERAAPLNWSVLIVVVYCFGCGALVRGVLLVAGVLIAAVVVVLVRRLAEGERRDDRGVG